MGATIIPSLKLPSLPFVYAGATISIPSNAAYSDVTLTEIIDKKGDYNGTSFTAPDNGTYHFIVTYKLVTATTYTFTRSVDGVDSADTSFSAISGVCNTYQFAETLTAGQVVKIRVKQTSGSDRSATVSLTIQEIS